MAKKMTAILLFCAVLSVSVMGASQTISSKQLVVTVSSEFPQVEQYIYKSNGGVIYGQQDSLNTVIINGTEYQPEVKFKKSRNKASYSMTFSEIDVRVDAQFIVKDNIMTFSVTKIQENGDTLVKTIDFPNHSLISIRSTQPDAQLTANRIVGADVYMPLADAKPTKGNASYLILNTDKVAVAIYNNTLDEWQRYKYEVSQKDGYKKASVASNLWIYREIDTEATELPLVKVIVTADENGDRTIDWQDGAIANRQIVERRYGSELIPNTFSHIAIDFASVTQWPFLRILDNVKKLSLYTDGFGQMLLVKGYESEGHDSAHPDYGNNFNTKAGGAEEFEFLCKTAKQYNTTIGVHINHTEAYPEARSYTKELVTENKGWRWLDQSWKIDRKADIVAGNLYKRLGELKENAPSLGFVYVDVYSGKNWVEWKLGEKLNDFGWPVWTEFHPHLDNYYIWTHQAAGGSKIGRFIMNDQKDTYRFDKLLKGYNHRGFMGWDTGGYEKDITRVVETFMTRNLPTKYMQNHELLKWDDNQAVFSGDLVSKDEDGTTNMYKDGNLIAAGNKVFIPWHPTKETKIYHWNPDGGESTWDLPKSWKRASKVILYQLTDLGRVLIAELPVTDGKVTITADAKIPYVLYKTRKSNKKMDWSEGSFVKDAGFNSHSFDSWKVSSRVDYTKHIRIANDDKGRTHLSVSGASNDAIISQEIKSLKAGQTYAASVWVQLTGKRSAGIRVSGLDDNDVERMIDKTDFICNFPNSDKNGTYYQRVKVLFDVPKGKSKATISLVANAGDADSIAMFDDVRVVEATRTARGDHYYFEDFENLDEGWGPFAYGYNGPCNTHVSELHEGFTDDTIDGRYSMKTMNEGHVGHVLRTLPSVVAFKPSTEYAISFDYRTDTDGMYKVVVDKPFDKAFVNSRVFATTYKATANADSLVSFFDVIGSSDKTAVDGALKLKSHGDVYVVNEDSPSVADGEYTFTISGSNAGRCGGVVRYASKEQFGFIGYDTGSKWVWGAGASWGTLSNSGPNIAGSGKTHTVKVRFVSTYFKVWVDGQLIFEGPIAAIPTGAGKTGFRNWFNSSAVYSDMVVNYSTQPLSPDEKAVGKALVSTDLTKPGGRFNASFKTTKATDTFAAFEKLSTGAGKLVIDNFTIDEKK